MALRAWKRWLAGCVVAVGLMLETDRLAAQFAPVPQGPPPAQQQNPPAGVNPGAPASGPYAAPPAGAPLPPGQQLPPGQPFIPGQQGQPTMIAPPVPQAPFLLTPEQERYIDDLLKIWEGHSAQVQTFSAQFTKYEYDATLMNDPRIAPRRLIGEVRYAKPDKGFFNVSLVEIWDLQQSAYQPTKEPGERWICDGQAIFEFNPTKKQLIEHRLPPEMQGKAISEGPLPFVFGIEAQKLRARYWIRDITPAEQRQRTVWLECFPKRQADAANYQRVEIILNVTDLMPTAVQIFLPNHQPNKRVSHVYAFKDIKRNAFLERLQDYMSIFVAPTTPLGWTRILDDPGVAQQPPAGPRSAQGAVPGAPFPGSGNVVPR